MICKCILNIYTYHFGAYGIGGLAVVTRALVFCLACAPSSLGPVALGIRVCISGRTLVFMLRLLNIPLWHLRSRGGCAGWISYRTPKCAI